MRINAAQSVAKSDNLGASLGPKTMHKSAVVEEEKELEVLAAVSYANTCLLPRQLIACTCLQHYS